MDNYVIHYFNGIRNKKDNKKLKSFEDVKKEFLLLPQNEQDRITKEANAERQRVVDLYYQYNPKKK